MRILAEKGLMAALGMLLALNFHPHADAMLVVAILAAICITSITEWLAASRWRWLPMGLFTLACIFLPLWRAFLPLAAYDAGRTVMPTVLFNSGNSGRNQSDGGRQDLVHRLMPFVRWTWVVPLFCAAADASTGSTTTIATSVFLVLVTCAGFALGSDSRRAEDASRRIRHLRDHARESLRANRRRLAEIEEERAQSVRMATLGERTRIAREIHDNVGHLLTRAIMQAQASRTVAEAMGEKASAQGFTALSGTLDDAMTMVRRSVHDLEDDGTDFAAQISAAVRSFDGISPGFAVGLANGIESAPAPVTRCFATVIREALANVVHHSEAHEATVTLRDMPALWQLVVQDPGPAKPGEAPTSFSDPVMATRHDAETYRGMGLADIDSRVRSLGGTSLCGPYGTGWRVFVSIPKGPWRSGAHVESGQS